MVGKLTAVLIRKEAEAYRSQGLHQEAFALYDELLSSTPNIDESLKSDIQSQMDDIAEEMEAFSSPKPDDESLSSKEMKLLKDGWEKNGASSADLMISAKGLCQIGAHHDALLEFGKLLKAGIAPDKVISATVECFLNLCDDKIFPAAVDKWLCGIYPDGQKVLAVHLLFIKELSSRSDKTHAFRYCRYIRSKPSLPAKLKNRLDAAGAKYKAAINQMEKNPKSKKESETINNSGNGAKTKDKTDNVQKSKVSAESEVDEISNETNNQILDELLAKQPQKLFRDDDPIDDEKEKKSQRKCSIINVIGWFRRVYRSILPPKKRDNSLQS